MLLRCLPLLVFTLTLSAQNTAVHVREDKLALPTYDEGAPDPNPQFGAFYSSPFPNYPYTPRPDFNKASTLSTLYVFPHREIYFRIFQTALFQNIADPVAHALLGDLYFDSLRTDEAIAEWRKALALKNDLPTLHRNLGRALLEIRNQPAAAAAVLTEGRRLHPDDREIADMLTRLNTH